MSGCPVHMVSDALRVVRRTTMGVDRFVQAAASRLPRRTPRPDAITAAERGAALVDLPPGAVSRALSDGAAGERAIAGIRGELDAAQWSRLGHRRVSAPIPDEPPPGALGRLRHSIRRAAHDLRVEFGHRPDPSRLDDADAVALRGRVQRTLQETFAPLADDMLDELRALRDVPLDELPRAGGAPVRTAYDHGTMGAATFRSNVDTGDAAVVEVAEHLRSQQHVPGSPRMQELDVVVPIGEYGEPMARALSEAARVMDAVALERLGPHTRALDANLDQVLGDWTFRRDTMPTLLEGNGSFAGVAGVFTHRRVPGLDGDELLRLIDQDHLFDRAAKGPLGLAGPMFFHGILPSESVVLTGGRLKPSKAYAALERGTRARRKLGRIWPSQVRATMRGCPVALRPPAAAGDAIDGARATRASHISQLGSEYIALARRFYQRELEQAAAAAAAAAAG